MVKKYQHHLMLIKWFHDEHITIRLIAFVTVDKIKTNSVSVPIEYFKCNPSSFRLAWIILRKKGLHDDHLADLTLLLSILGFSLDELTDAGLHCHDWHSALPLVIPHWYAVVLAWVAPVLKQPPFNLSSSIWHSEIIRKSIANLEIYMSRNTLGTIIAT